jgi:general secretion pathway protein N
MKGLPRLRRRGGKSVVGWGESTFAEVAWDRSRGAGLRWSVAGAVIGGLLALLAFAPAAWLSNAVAAATEQRLVLADARGTVWSGSAVAVLTGGPDSRDASSLPGRLDWNLGLGSAGLELRTRHACCLNGTVVLRLKPGLGRMTAILVPPAGWVGQWPSALLGGLGTPWNTLQLGGMIRLASPGLQVESVQGRLRIDGRAEIELVDVASRLSTLATLGSYRITLTGDASDVSHIALSTDQGALQLSGDGTWSQGSGVRFRGEARASGPTEEAALSNLLNIIGRRNGARSVISIG